MLKLFLDEETADVFFRVTEQNGGQFSSSSNFCAHLAILKVCAPALADLCKGCNRATPVPITDVKRGIFKQLLYYVYGGKILHSEMESHSKEIMEAADRYDIPTLKIAAEGCYVKSVKITIDNFVDVYQYEKVKILLC
ncbi:hypothetical protein ACHAXR_011650 [Thalassiosira sp. AJA248-18]